MASSPRQQASDSAAVSSKASQGGIVALPHSAALGCSARACIENTPQSGPGRGVKYHTISATPTAALSVLVKEAMPT